MVFAEKCEAIFSFSNEERPIICTLPKGHSGRHKASGCLNVEDYVWSLSWGPRESKPKDSMKEAK